MGAYYIPALGRDRTPHQVARDFGREDVFRFLMERSPQDVKLSQACQLGDENLFRAMLAARPSMTKTLSDQERRQVAEAAQSNNTEAVRLMLGAGWPVDARGEYDMTPLQWASWHGNAEMVREILEYHPHLELSCDHRITALGSALHGSMNGWHRDTGDYVATVSALLAAGAKAPKVTDDLEASEPVRELLIEHAE
jgi:ankyrin repeat protein